jgi:hypothetical protein
MSDADAWRNRTDEEVAKAAAQLTDFTEAGERAIRTTRPCTRQGAEVWPISFVGGQSLRRALQVKAGVRHS